MNWLSVFYKGVEWYSNYSDDKISLTVFWSIEKYKNNYKSHVHLCICNIVAVDGNWGAWSTVAECSVTCGTGHSTRVRACNNPPPSNGGKVCVGDTMVVEQCVLSECPYSVSGNSTSYGDLYINVSISTMIDV